MAYFTRTRLGVGAATVAALLLVYGISYCTQARADSHETVPYSQAGGWKILVDRTVGNGCFAIATFPSGTIVRVGWNRSDQRFYILYGNTNWERLRVGGDYPVRFVFDDSKTYSGTLKGVDIAGNTLLYHSNVDETFMVDFAKRDTLAVYNKTGGLMARLSLDSTQQALNEVVRCQKEMNM